MLSGYSGVKVGHVQGILLLAGRWDWVTAHPVKRSLQFLFLCVLLTEIVLRVFFAGSEAAKAWTGFFTRVSNSWILQFLAKFWTGVILSVVYFLTLPFITLFQRLSGSDPLDRGLKPEPSFWRKHEANPLGPKASARHQF
jgi:hypothetical protein